MNEVVRGLNDAGHLDSVTLSVIPAGTANLLAGNIGVTTSNTVSKSPISERRDRSTWASPTRSRSRLLYRRPPRRRQRFDSGRPRRAVRHAGVRSPAHRRRFASTVSYRHRGSRGDVRLPESGEATACWWATPASSSPKVGRQLEDGLLDVAIVDGCRRDLVAEAIGQRLLALDTDGVTHVRADEITIAGHGTELTPVATANSHARDASLSVRETTLTLRVGPGDEPDPV